MPGMKGGVGGGGDAGQTFEQGVGWGIEVPVGDAEDATLLHGFQVVPVALYDDSFERDSVPCSAP